MEGRSKFFTTGLKFNVNFSSGWQKLVGSTTFNGRIFKNQKNLLPEIGRPYQEVEMLGTIEMSKDTE